jgi:hypothetical protein
MAAQAVRGAHFVEVRDPYATYGLNRQQAIHIWSEEPLNEETVKKVCTILTQWSMVMGELPYRNAKFNNRLGRAMAIDLSKDRVLKHSEYQHLASTAARFLKVTEELKTALTQHKIVDFRLPGLNYHFQSFEVV